MRISEIATLERSDLNPFLFSVIGSERNGSEFSVFSLLARTGADPWREAGRLASLPKQAAKDWLAQAIAGGPTSMWALPEATIIAARLITSLPRRIGGEDTPAPRPALRIGDVRNLLMPFALTALGAAILFALMHIGMH